MPIGLTVRDRVRTWRSWTSTANVHTVRGRNDHNMDPVSSRVRPFARERACAGESPYQRSASSRRHRIERTPSGFFVSPGSISMCVWQPFRHLPRRRTGCPGRSQRRTMSFTQAYPSVAQISVPVDSAKMSGRATAIAGRQSCGEPASGHATTSSPSSTQPEGHVATGIHGHSHDPFSTPFPQERVTCAACDASTRPSMQRRSPSEQSVPPRSKGRDGVGAPSPEVSGVVPPTPRSATSSSGIHVRTHLL